MPSVIVAVDCTIPTWTDSGIVLAPNSSKILNATGTIALGPFSGSRPANPGGAQPFEPLIGDGFVYGYYAATGDASVQTAGYGALVGALKQDGTGPPDISPRTQGPSPIGYAFCPGNATNYQLTNTNLVSCRLWFIANISGFYYFDVTGGPYSVSISDPVQPSITSPVVTACQKCCSSLVKVTWTQSFYTDITGTYPATSYTISRQVNGTGSFITLAIVLQNDALLYIDTDTKVGYTYDYRVVAVYQPLTSSPGDAIITVKGFTSDAPISCTFTSDAPISCTFTDPDACTC